MIMAERYREEWLYFISNDPSLSQKHGGVPDGSDGCDGTSYPLTAYYTLLVALAMGPVAYVPPVLCVRNSGDVYRPIERHGCYTLCRGCSYAEAIAIPPGDDCACSGQVRHLTSPLLLYIGCHSLPIYV